MYSAQNTYSWEASVGHRWRHQVAWGLLALLTVPAFGPAAESSETSARKPAVGIISVPELRRAADVLTVALSSDSALTLLERNEIDRVLNEQHLSASGLASENYARLGRLLGADGLVFLDTAKINDQPVLSVRIVAAGPGVIVGACYAKHPPEDLQKWATDLTERVHGLAPKLGIPVGQAIPVSVLNLRSALPMHGSRDLERGLTLMLTHRLASEPRLFVLERVRMQKLAFEKALASGSPSDFWSSSYVVDGEITRSSSNALSVKLRLERPGRDPQTVQAEGSTKELQGVTELLASKLRRQMGQNNPATAWRPLEEGQRFYAEAKSAFEAGLLEESLAAAEASRILGCESVALREMLLNLYVLKTFKEEERSAIKSVPIEDVDLDSALRGLDLYAGLLEEHVPIRFTSVGRLRHELGPLMFWNASRVIRWYRENDLYTSRREDLELLRERIRYAAQLFLAKGGAGPLYEFYCVMACYAPYWYDEPAQVLKAYEATLAPSFNDYASAISWVRHYLTQYRDKPNPFGTQDLDQRTPWLIDWKGAGKQPLDDVWRRFVQARLESPALNDRLDGLLLAFYSTESHEAQASITERAKAEVWTNRETVVSNQVTFAITTQLISGLPFGEDFRFQILDCFLRTGRFFDYGFFSACFGSGFTNRAHAETLYESMREFEQRGGLTGPYLKGMESSFHDFQEQLARAFPGLRQSPANGLNVTLSWPRLSAAQANKLVYWPRQVLYAAGAIWVSADETLKDGFQTTFTRVELPAFTTAVWQAPFTIPRAEGGSMDDFNHAFAVAGEWLFWVHGGKLARGHLATGKWEELEVPPARFPLLKFVNGYLYYAFPSEPHQWAYEPQVSGILSIDPRAMRIEVLASSRRKPAKSRLDDVPAYFVYDLFSGPGNQLYASVLSKRNPRRQGELYRYSETEKEWTLAHSEVGYYFDPHRVASFDSGNVIQPIGCDLERTFILYQDGTLEFLFPDPYQLRKPAPTRWPHQPPMWEHTPWNPVVATADGNDLWVLGARRSTESAPLNLYLYKRGVAERRTAPLYFPSAHTENYPTMDSGPVQLLGTPEGLVIAGTRDTGFWFLPKQELQAFFAPSVQPGPTGSAAPLEVLARDRSQGTNSVASRP